MNTIRVVHNHAGNCINFYNSTQPVYWNGCLEASVAAGTTDKINIENKIRDVSVGSSIYEFFRVPYTLFANEDNVGFSSAQAAVDYINAAANTVQQKGRFIMSDDDFIDFKVDDSRQVILLNNGDEYPVDFLQATSSGVTTTTMNIVAREADDEVIIYENLRVANVTIDSVGLGTTASLVVNELNDLFTQAGSTFAPVISSGSSITIGLGSIFNYELETTGGNVTAYEWLNLPEGVVQILNKPNKIIGGSTLSPGTYNADVRVHNFVGVASTSITINVTTDFVNGLSTKFQNLDFARRGSIQSDEFTNLAKAVGAASSAYTLSFWFKPGNNTHLGQNIFNAFSQNNTFAGTSIIQVQYNGNTSTTRNIKFKVQDQSGGLDASNYNLNLDTPVGAVRHINGSNGFHHIVITNSGAANSYQVSTLGIKIYINGVDQTLTDNSNGGGLPDAGIGTNTFSIDPNIIALGRQPTNANYMRDSKLDELAFWNSELNQSQITSVYNSGFGTDLSSFSPSPAHWYRMGDGDTFPTISDSIGSADLTMSNMTAANFVSEVPS